MTICHLLSIQKFLQDPFKKSNRDLLVIEYDSRSDGHQGRRRRRRIRLKRAIVIYWLLKTILGAMAIEGVGGGLRWMVAVVGAEEESGET